MNTIKNILVVRTDRIGDVILTTPAIRALKERYPQSRLTVLVAPLTYDLLHGLPWIDEILVDDRAGLNKGVMGFCHLIHTMRFKKFDAAIVFHTKRRTNLACFLAGIPYRLGYKNNKYGFLLNHPISDQRHTGKKHERDYCLDLVRELEVKTANIYPEVSVHEQAERWIGDYLKGKGIETHHQLYIIHPAASDPAKQWPLEHFAELIDEIAKKNSDARFMIVGSKDNQSTARSIQNKTNAEVRDTSGLLTIRQLVSLIGHSHMLISNDSGPVHIAAAQDVPVISIFTRNQPGINPQRWQPLGEKSRVVSVAPDAGTDFRKSRPYDPKSMKPIPVRDVVAAVDSLLKLC